MSSLRERCDAIAWQYADPPDQQWLDVATLIAAEYIPPETGRHSVIGSKETTARLFTHLARGNYLDTACDLAGVSEVTVRSLMKRGEAGEEPFDAFLAVVKRAQSKAEADAVWKVLKAGEDPRFWTAPATWLERKFPQKYGRRQEDSNVARVIVQIGAVDSDVKVLVQGGSITGDLSE